MKRLTAFWKSLHPKVIAATIGSLLASALIGGIVAAQASPEIMGGLPSWAVFAVAALVPTVTTFLTGYIKASPASPAG